MLREYLIPFITDIVLPLLEAGLFAIGSYLLLCLREWLKAKGLAEKTSMLTSKLGELVEDMVREANQTLVVDLKTKGEWDSETGAKIRSNVREKALRLVGDRASVAKALGLTGTELEERVETMIEAAIDRQKGSVLEGLLVDADPGSPKIEIRLPSDGDPGRLLDVLRESMERLKGSPKN